MSALTVGHDPEQSWDDLVRFWEEMDWPEGSKVEIIEGIITVSPAPASRHNVIAERIQRRLYSVIPEDWGVYQAQAIAVPSRLGMFIPDILVAPVQAGAGVELHAKPGDPVTEGQPLLTLHTDTPERFEYALQAVEGSYDVGAAGTAFTASPVVLERIA